jgi:hypothetical protein
MKPSGTAKVGINTSGKKVIAAAGETGPSPERQGQSVLALACLDGLRFYDYRSASFTSAVFQAFWNLASTFAAALVRFWALRLCASP